MTKTPKAPAMVRRSAGARRAWRDLWALLEDNGLDDDLYTPSVAVLAMQLGLASDSADAVFRPIDPLTGKRFRRTLEQYLAGVDFDPRSPIIEDLRTRITEDPQDIDSVVELLKLLKPTARNSQTAQELTVLRDSLRQAAKVAGEFGMSPAARARVDGEEKPADESPMMAYIRAANERMRRRDAS